MLEHFFSDSRALQRHRGGHLGPYVDGFAAFLHDQGYARESGRAKIRDVTRLNQWLKRRKVGVEDLSLETISLFLRDTKRHQRTRQGQPATLHALHSHLCNSGLITDRRMARNDEAYNLECVFAKHLEQERALSKKTVRTYRLVARVFLSACFGDGPVAVHHLSARDIVAFICRQSRMHSRAWIHVISCGLRSFLRFLRWQGELSANLADHVPKAADWSLSTVPKWLEPSEIQKVLQNCDRGTSVGKRNYAILLLLARLGLRAGEIVGLELDHIHWETGEIVVQGKGYQRKRLPLPHDVGEAIVAYLKNGRPATSSRRVFIRLRAPYRGLGNSCTVGTLVRRALAAAGVDPPCKGSHVFRHSLATELLRRGASLGEIGQILHHKKPDTTAIYAKVHFDALRELAQPWPGDNQ